MLKVGLSGIGEGLNMPYVVYGQTGKLRPRRNLDEIAKLAALGMTGIGVLVIAAMLAFALH